MKRSSLHTSLLGISTLALMVGSSALSQPIAPTGNYDQLPTTAPIPDGMLHVLRPVVHTEQDLAELCIEFDRPLNPALKKGSPLTVQLQQAGKAIPITTKDIAITGETLCLPPLEYQRDYTLKITGARGNKDERLSEPYTLSFTTPQRPSLLAFVASGDSGSFTRWTDEDPTLRAVNVVTAQIELYRITAPEKLAQAWEKKQQTALAPSESAYFAHESGEKVWSGTVSFDTAANKDGTQKIPLHGIPNLGPGLYLVVATTPTGTTPPVPTGTTSSTSTDKEQQPGLNPQAAQWLVRGDLRVSAIRDGQNILCFTADADGKAAKPNIALRAFDSANMLLVSSTTNADGITTLTLPNDKTAAVVIADTTLGDVAFAAPAPLMTTTPPTAQGSISGLAGLLTPFDKPTITLTAPVANTRNAIKSSQLSVRSLDGRIASQTPVPDITDHTTIHIAPPAKSGSWKLVWQNADGAVLAQQDFRTAFSPDAPRLTLSPDRKMIGTDGNIDITVTSAREDGTAVGFVAGTINAAWTHSDSLFPKWDDYHFGLTEDVTGPAPTPVHFVTDAHGAVHLHLTLPVPDDVPNLAATLTLNADPVSEAALPSPITLPLHPRSTVIGIKATTEDGHFGENGLARFSVIAVDGDGNRVATDGLTYNVYDEGRSFEWYQADGLWNYKPLQHLRRLGGKPLTVSADHDATIEWPVTAGTYRLDIVDDDNNIVARSKFVAGWGGQRVPPAPLALQAPPSAVYSEATSIKFNLAKPSMVSTIISSNNRIESVHYTAMPAGNNDVTIKPEKEWGAMARVRIAAQALREVGEAFVTLGEAQTTKPSTSPTIHAVHPTNIAPASLSLNDELTLNIDLNTIVGRENASTAHYTITAGAGLKVTSGASGKGARNSAKLVAIEPGLWDITIEAVTTQGTKAVQQMAIAVRDLPRAFTPLTLQTLAPNETLPLKPALDTHGKAAQQLNILSAAPLFDAPALLARSLAYTPLTTRDFADQLMILGLWQDFIAGSGLMSSGLAQERKETLTLNLLQRQKVDGSFTPLFEKDGDIATTSDAVMAILQGNPAVTAPALHQATEWLQSKLQNTWFGDDERAPRAAAYNALAMAGNMEAASLHYFSDTSAQKPMPPAASAAMAASFASLNDKDAAAFWLDRVKFNKDDVAPDADLITLLPGLFIFNPDDATAALTKLSAQLTQGDFDLHKTAEVLRAVMTIQNRAGDWQIDLNGTRKAYRGPLVIDTSKAITVHNREGRPLTLAHTMFTLAALPPAPDKDGMTRYIYDPSGALIDMRGGLDLNQTYLVVIEGPWPHTDNRSDAKADTKSEQPALFIHDETYPALNPIGCALSSHMELPQSLNWAASIKLNDTDGCEKSGNALTLTAHHRDGDGANWRFAYFAVSPWEGRFNGPRATLNNLGNSVNSGPGHIIQIQSDDKIQVKK